MTTVQILTKNNAVTVAKAIESCRSIGPVLVADLGSTDGTKELCRSLGVEFHNFSGMERHEARNRLAALSPGTKFYLEPWEIVATGHKAIGQCQKTGYVPVIHENTLTKQIRLWNNERFVNPIYERIDSETEHEIGATIYSTGGIDLAEARQILKKWKMADPLSKVPYYYEACTALSQGQYTEFVHLARHYLFLDSTQSMSATMTRYYFALVQLTQLGDYKGAFQNLNLCMCTRPLMAEFWCLTGDVHYHLLNQLGVAKEFYENAMFLGSRRLKTDKWPMEISKYRSYPKMMIESCDKMVRDLGVQPSRSDSLSGPAQ